MVHCFPLTQLTNTDPTHTNNKELLCLQVAQPGREPTYTKTEVNAALIVNGTDKQER